MELEKILLSKEEIPISDTFFIVPIHAKLISLHINLDEQLANKVFPQAAEDWYKDLQEYSENLRDNSKKEWIKKVFLNKKPFIEKYYGKQRLNPPGYWEDDVLTIENGFASSLSINRNFGGSLYLDSSHQVSLVPYTVKFSPEKFLEFRCEKTEYDGDGSEGVLKAHIYHSHNIDYYPGALFLRNWAILYLNEALKQIFKNKKL